MLLFAEGFDDFSTNADLLMTSSADPTATTVTGRTGAGKAAQISGTGYINFGFPARAVIIAGFAFKGSSTLGLSSTEWLRIQFQAGGVTLFTIVQRSAAGLDFFDATANGYDFTTGWLGSASFSNFSSYIEVKLTPGYTGQVLVRIDGATVLNIAGNFSVPLSTTMFDDLYVIDTTGARNNTFLGDVRITSLAPTGDGADSGWAPNAGSTHYTHGSPLPTRRRSFSVSPSTSARLVYAVTRCCTAIPVPCGTFRLHSNTFGRPMMHGGQFGNGDCTIRPK